MKRKIKITFNAQMCIRDRSSGLRALHDERIIQLSHKLDSGDMWFLYEAELHPIKSTVTHVTVRR